MGIPVLSLLLGFTPTDPEHIFASKACENRVRRIFGDIHEYKSHPFKIKNLKVENHSSYHVYLDPMRLNKQIVLKEKVEIPSRTIASDNIDNRPLKHLFSRYKDLINNIVIIETDDKIRSVSYQNSAYCEFNKNIKCTCE